MKVNVCNELKTFDGIRLEFPDMEKPTAGAIFIMLLFASPAKDKQGNEGKEKFKRYQLAERINAAEKAGSLVEITVEEAATIKEIAGHWLTPKAIGPVWNALEANDALDRSRPSPNGKLELATDG